MHAVMKHWDPMLGCDFHMVTIPPAPLPGPMLPYFTCQFTSGLYLFFKPMWSQATLYGVTVEKTTDIGSGIPHIGNPVAVELPMMIIFSASKSHFASSTYHVGQEGKNPALGLLVFANPNLNCGMPCPTPTGISVNINTHVAGMTWGDIGAGFGAMYADMLIQTLLNGLGLAFGKWSFGKWGDSRANTIAGYAWTGLNFLFGGPMGMDMGTFGLIKDQKGEAWTPGGALTTLVSSLTEGVGRAVGDYLDGNPPQAPVPDIRKPSGIGFKIPNVTDNPPP